MESYLHQSTESYLRQSTQSYLHQSTENYPPPVHGELPSTGPMF